MPAFSEKHHRFFGMVFAMKCGDTKKTGHAGPVARNVSQTAAREFATKKK